MYMHATLNKPFSDITLAELLACFEQAKDRGDVAVIKLDGLRKENQYTVFITSPKGEMIRADEATLKEAMYKVLVEYATQNL
jgi:hypothetical protein